MWFWLYLTSLCVTVRVCTLCRGVSQRWLHAWLNPCAVGGGVWIRVYVCESMHGPERNVRMCMSFEIQLLETLYTPVCVFTLFSACAHVCVCVCVCSHAHGCSHISLSPGDDAKNMWLLKPSGVWAASVCSPFPSLRPSLPFVRYSCSLHSSLNYTLFQTQYLGNTHARTQKHKLHPAVSLLHFHWGWPLLSRSGIKESEWKGEKKGRKGWRAS